MMFLFIKQSLDKIIQVFLPHILFFLFMIIIALQYGFGWVTHLYFFISYRK